jgi:hypothetical protein
MTYISGASVSYADTAGSAGEASSWTWGDGGGTITDQTDLTTYISGASVSYADTAGSAAEASSWTWGDGGGTISDQTDLMTYLSDFIKLTSLSASSPLSYDNTTGAFMMYQSSASADGYLSSTDWSTFNGKANAFSGYSGTVTFLENLAGDTFQLTFTNGVVTTGP